MEGGWPRLRGSVAGLRRNRSCSSRLSPRRPLPSWSYPRLSRPRQSLLSRSRLRRLGLRRPGTRRSRLRRPGTRRPGTRRPGTRRPGTRRPGTRRPGTRRPGLRRSGTRGGRGERGVWSGGGRGVGGEAGVLERSGAGSSESMAAGERRGASWLVVAGVILVLAAVAAAAGVLVVATHGLRHKTVVAYRPAAVFSLRAGDCINSSQNGLSVTILSCATPHEAEVFATFSLTGSSWPGDAAVQEQANSGCASRIAGYLNPQLLNAGLTQQYVYPNQDAWKADVRTVVCEVSSDSGPLSGSVRNGG